MKNYVKPQFEYIELTVSEKVSLCIIDVGGGVTFDGACPS